MFSVYVFLSVCLYKNNVTLATTVEGNLEAPFSLAVTNYHKILKNKITNTCIIDYNDTVSLINHVTRKFANKLHIEDRLGKFNMKDAYAILKDHQQNFENKIKSRLINK